MEQYKHTYLEEARELLGELEISLLELEERPDDGDLIGRVFRAMHTIKGSGAMFGFDEIAEFTHEVETVFDLVRKGELLVTPEMVNLALAARDNIKEMFESGGRVSDAAKSAKIIASLKALVPEKTEKETEGDLGASAYASARLGSPETFRIRFKPDADIFTYGVKPVLILNELRELGDCHAMAHVDAIPPLEEMNPEDCLTKWDIVLTTDRGRDAVRDVFIFVEDNCQLSIDVIGGDEIWDDPEYKRIGEIMVDRGDLRPGMLEQFLGGRKPLGELLVEADIVDRETVESALAEQEHVRAVRKRLHDLAQVSSVRVPAEKLDVLVNLVGELVTVQARLNQLANVKGDSDLVSVAEMVERLTGELRDNTMSMRMLPIGMTFNRFKRLIRDLSHELGKEVAMVMDGGETELDKTVMDRLNDPLIHIIRNSMDHGIEHPDIRESKGKPRQGKITISAEHTGANVLIRLTDDGMGLDSARIRADCVRKGLIPPDADLPEDELYALIFMPGMSTAEEITGMSGRGVGMDVVKKSVESLGGTIEIRSEKGAGTSVTLKLPLTLAIVDGLLVGIGENRFVFPLSAVEECVEMNRDDAEKAGERNMMNLRGDAVPFLELREMFEIAGAGPAIEPVVIVEADGERIGFGVDKVIGHHQTVLKSLGNMYKDIEGISGATILGDGTVALILDVPVLVQTVEKERKKAV